MRDFFKYKVLKIFFRYMKDEAPVFSFRDWDGGSGIILRHDVDYDIKKAHELFLIEKDYGIISTFFIMVTCPIYNPLSAENRELPLEIKENGFEIGLHFDPSVYKSDILKSCLDDEVRILEKIIDTSVKSISLHNTTIYGSSPTFDGYINAHNELLFSDENYFADSCGDFRGKDPFEMVQQAKNIHVQMVLHPIFYSNEGNTFASLVETFIDRLNRYGSVNPLYVQEVLNNE